jgi:hypothetical protein
LPNDVPIFSNLLFFSSVHARITLGIAVGGQRGYALLQLLLDATGECSAVAVHCAASDHTVVLLLLSRLVC